MGVKVIKSPASEGLTNLQVKMHVGRNYWLFAMRHVLSKTLFALESHHWTILTAPTGLQWFTSDDPVLLINFNNLYDYNFDGGWNRKGSEIILPLSPRHLFYTQVGKPVPRLGTEMGVTQAVLIRQLIAEHAFRDIYAYDKDVGVPVYRPRHISEQSVRHEKVQWQRWHEEQSKAEQELIE